MCCYLSCSVVRFSSRPVQHYSAQQLCSDDTGPINPIPTIARSGIELRTIKLLFPDYLFPANVVRRFPPETSRKLFCGLGLCLLGPSCGPNESRTNAIRFSGLPRSSSPATKKQEAATFPNVVVVGATLTGYLFPWPVVGSGSGSVLVFTARNHP